MNLINSPEDLKSLGARELADLAAEIRKFLIGQIARTGGHLASNLGVVELTLALHKTFNAPADKIVWDVGHQAYVHKILTGRQGQFDSLRKLDGLSGFPKSRESVYDAFDVGHSSTAISAALGFCCARDLQEDKYSVAAVVGDGSMTGGLAYEALNNAGRSNTDLLVILNDNQMSIARNVGALSRHLNDIRTAPVYRSAKNDVHRLLRNLPRLDKWIENAKDTLKFILLPGVLFEEMGFQYFGPVDGHNLPALLNTLQNLRSIKGPVLLHVMTTKGKGFSIAERSPDAFHCVEPFDLASAKPLEIAKSPTYTDIFGESMVKLAANSSAKIVAITASMCDGTGLRAFQEKFPKQIYDVGIAEGHAVTFAAGMAKAGVVPVVAIYSSFLQRAYDQILHDVCMQNLHVVFAVDRAGLVGPDGETHQGIFDLSFLSHMPNMAVLAPRNGAELADMLHYAVLQHKGPIALRYPKGEVSTLLEGEAPPIELGKSELIYAAQPGSKIKNAAIVSVGTMMDEAYPAMERLHKLGYDVELYNARFVKPLDTNLATHLRSYRHVFILEDNVRAGGYGSLMLAEFSLSAPRVPAVHLMAFPDGFVEQGKREELFRRYALDKEGVCKQISKILENSKG